ncbi:MAG: FAD-binding oxidoreductase [Myxococcaceae bacterium]|nr:FAD-binding oxidoreductase [Myxococcaceae bacterium]
MKRWNGWGDEEHTYVVPRRAVEALAEWVGPGAPARDATLAEAAATVPESRLPHAPFLSFDPQQRLRHARGQSLPDWVALRSGRISTFPDAVAWPETSDDVRTLLGWAARTGARLIPHGGGTSVAGHVNPDAGGGRAVTVSLRRMNHLLELDEVSRLARFGAGVTGPELEARLRERSLTLGHFPQSFEQSTLGGWIATRSSGQQSLLYGRIERLFAGGRVETPRGPLVLPVFPASAAGPDLREWVLGSEGRLGFITEATVRVSPVPEREEFVGVFFPDWQHGLAAARAVAQARLPLCMVRLSAPEEARTMLTLAGHERLLGALEAWLRLRGAGDEKALLLLGASGTAAVVRFALGEALSLTKQRGGLSAGRTFGAQWTKNRFCAPYLRNALWELGYAVDTFETAAPWSAVPSMLARVEAALRTGLQRWGERTHVFTHLSHVYTDGSSIYTTVVFRLADTPEETLERWSTLKARASEAIVAAKGTISHQHGVGTDHARYLAAEKGALGIAALERALAGLDPDSVMNPGKLLPSVPGRA